MTISQGCIGQMNLFDLFPADKSEKFNPVSEYAMKGSLFVNGKSEFLCIFQRIRTNQTELSF